MQQKKPLKQKPLFPKHLQTGMLTAGTNAEFPPFEYVGDDGEADGFDIALYQGNR